MKPSKFFPAILAALQFFMSGLLFSDTGADPDSRSRGNESNPLIAPLSRTTLSVVVPWHSPIGLVNGIGWAVGPKGYNYQSAKQSGGILNFPLLNFQVPATVPDYGGKQYYELQYQAALEQLTRMRDAGIDVAVLSLPPSVDFDPSQSLSAANQPLRFFGEFLEWLKAAEKTGMKVAIGTEMWAAVPYVRGKRRTPNVDQWVKILSGTLDHIPDSPALWKIDGRPTIIHFGTDTYYESMKAGAPDPTAPTPDRGWRHILARLRNDGKKFFFFADIRPHDQILEWNRIADGAYIFAPGAPASWANEYQRDISRQLTIPYMWFVSPGYYNSAHTYAEPSFSRVHDIYMAAIKSNAKLMYIMSWNDVGEDHDIWPSSNKGSCLLDIFSFYNAWFKEGRQPVLSSDKVILAYPMRIPDKVVTLPAKFGGGRWASPAYAPKIFYWAYLKSPQTLEVSGVGKVVLPAGLSLGELGSISPSKISLVPIGAILNGRKANLPPVKRIRLESRRSKEGGLEFRYVDLTARADTFAR